MGFTPPIMEKRRNIMNAKKVRKYLDVSLIQQALRHLIDYSDDLTLNSKLNLEALLRRNQVENCITALKEELK